MEVLFKGIGTNIMKKLNPPKDISVQFSPKGSYREDNLIAFIKSLPNIRFKSPEGAAIFLLDNYSVHLSKNVKAVLIHKGYIPVYIGGGITGEVQINDTHFHHPLKAAYRLREQELMLKRLEAAPDKIPGERCMY